MDWARHPQLMKRMIDLQENQVKHMQAVLAKPVRSAKP
jgi:hypothetical protein